jgi:hypothetical protein
MIVFLGWQDQSRFLRGFPEYGHGVSGCGMEKGLAGSFRMLDDFLDIRYQDPARFQNLLHFRRDIQYDFFMIIHFSEAFLPPLP